jgi:putative transposase
LKEADSGMKVADVCCKHGIATPTYYAWKSKFGGMDVSEAQKFRSLEEENKKLKRLVADQALDIMGLKELLSKKW